MPVSLNQRQDMKVSWFFSSEKNQTLLFLKKEKNNLYFWG